MGIQVGNAPESLASDGYDDSGSERRAVWDAKQVCHQTSGRDCFSTIATACERQPREGLHKDSMHTLRSVRTLCKTGRLKQALHHLNQQCIQADSQTYISVLQECINVKGLAEGKQVHAHIIQNGFRPNILVLNNLVNMYVKCGSVVDARQVFDKMSERDIFTWNIMIAGYAKHGLGKDAFKIYEQLQRERGTPDKVTFVCILNACSSVGAWEKAKEVHADIIKAGISRDVILETALANMYAKCGSMKDAHKVFDKMAQRNVVSWSAMIAGYAQQGCGREALEMYEQMQWEGVIPNRVTFICALNACGSIGALEKGRDVHADIIKAGIAWDTILETALTDMYAKCRSIKDARRVFDNMAKRNVLSWNAMIAGYAQHGFGNEVLEIYGKMHEEGVKPDRFTFTGVLNACANLGALEMGKKIHADIIKAGIPSDKNLETALGDMYAKCGSMKDAREVFESSAGRDKVSWNAMITAYAHHGCCREARLLFKQMQQEGLKPDGVTFISLLSACRHVGLVDEGRHYFDSMSRDHGVTPTAEHFGCMVDLLGRAGRLEEAEDLINQTPIDPDSSVWGALLAACRTHGNVEVAERAAKGLLKQGSHPVQLISCKVRQ